MTVTGLCPAQEEAKQQQQLAVGCATAAFLAFATDIWRQRSPTASVEETRAFQQSCLALAEVLGRY